MYLLTHLRYFREPEYHNLEAVINSSDIFNISAILLNVMKMCLIFIVYIFKNTTNTIMAFAFVHN